MQFVVVVSPPKQPVWCERASVRVLANERENIFVVRLDDDADYDDYYDYDEERKFRSAKLNVCAVRVLCATAASSPSHSGKLVRALAKQLHSSRQ